MFLNLLYIFLCLYIYSAYETHTVFAKNCKNIFDPKKNCSEGSTSFDNETKLVKIKSVKWLDDDWQLGNSKKSLFSFVLDARWDDFPISCWEGFILKNYSFSFSMCVCSVDDLKYKVESDKFVNNTEKFLPGHTDLESNITDNCTWFHYSLLRKNNSLQVTNVNNVTNVSLEFDPSSVAITNSSVLKLHKYEFNYSETTNLDNPTRLNLTFEPPCFFIFVSVDKNCFLNITLTQNNRTIGNETILGFNEERFLRKWKEVRIESEHKLSVNLLFVRGRYDNKTKGYWAIDGLYQCRQNSNITSKMNNSLETDSSVLKIKIPRIVCDTDCESCDETTGNCKTCKTGLFGVSCSETLPKLLWPPAVVLPITEDRILITLEESQYGDNETKPEFLLVKYTEMDTSNNYKVLPVQPFDTNVTNKSIEIKSNNARKIKEIKVILMINRETYNDDVPVINPQTDLMDVSCENNVVKVSNWKPVNNTNNFYLEYECISESFSKKNSTREVSFDFEADCVNFTVKLYDTYPPLNRIYLKRKISGVCENGSYKMAIGSYKMAILGSVIIIAVCIGVAFLLYRLFLKKTSTQKANSESEDQEMLVVDTDNAQISVNEFDEKLKTILKKKVRMQFDSFSDLQITKTCFVGMSPQNVKKNRDQSPIVPYDDNRVILQALKGFSSEDYINASYIDSDDRPKAYIACQGPKFHTVLDFWRMIWQENAKLVVMTTDLMENNKRLCAEYWPQDRNKIFECGQVKIKCVEEQSYEFYYCRKLEVSYDNEKRTITHCHLKWNRENIHFFYPNNVLGVLKIIREFYENNSTPIVIHSRYGNGRAAILILCDLALQMAKTECKIDFCSLTKILLRQRPKMIKHVEHYILAHLIVDEFLKDQNNPFKKSIDILIDSELVREQFEYLESLEFNDEYFEKNVLEKEENFSSYKSVTRYGGTRNYLLIRDTTLEEVDEMWKIIALKDVRNILVLNKKETEWTYSRVTPIETIHVRHLKTVTEENFFTLIQVSLLIYKTGSKETIFHRNLFVYLVKNWNEKKLASQSVEQFIVFLNKFQEMKDKNILISCADGTTASGLFVVLSYIFEKYDQELEFDVCNAIRIARRTGKKIVTTHQQLQFIYAVVKAYKDKYQKV